MSWQASNCHLDKVTKLLFQAEALSLIDERTALRTSAFSAKLFDIPHYHAPVQIWKELILLVSQMWFSA